MKNRLIKFYNEYEYILDKNQYLIDITVFGLIEFIVYLPFLAASITCTVLNYIIYFR